jgi:ankyrin repeat protein
LEIDSTGETPLALAAQHGHAEVMELLISKGALTFRDCQGQTCIHFAAAKGYTSQCSSLLDLRKFAKIFDF